jgi:hypothetical protein
MTKFIHRCSSADTRTAFAVKGTTDYSVMGGAVLLESGAAFRTTGASYAYSWFDLYLLGLADPSEVPRSFYLTDVVWDNAILAYHANRVDVTLDQIVTAMEPRQPTYPATNRDFTVAFVILEDPTQPTTAEDINRAETYRAAFERDFAQATGRRAAFVGRPCHLALSCDPDYEPRRTLDQTSSLRLPRTKACPLLR